MKKIITLSLACLFILHHLSAQQAAKATATGSRLTGQSTFTYYNGPAEDIDSMAYIYSGTRGGDLNSVLKYDSLIDMYPGNGSINYINTQTFDDHDNIITNVHLQNNGATLVNSSRDSFAYDGNNNKIADVNQTWDATNNVWVNSRYYLYTYDASHNMLTTVDSDWNGSAYVFHYNIANTYNSGNKLVNEQENINGEYFVFIHTYDVNGNLIADTSKDGSNINALPVTYLTLYTYDGNNNKIADTAYSSYQTGTLTLQNRHLDSGFVAHQPLSETYQLYSASASTWTSSYKYYYTYNSSNQLLTADNEDPDANGNFPGQPNNSTIQYYYENYTLSVNNISNAGGTASIYPVPAQTQLHIDLTWDAPQAFTIAISDMQGRVVKQWQVPAISSYHNTIAVNDLNEGSYIINIAGANGSIVKKLIVSK